MNTMDIFHICNITKLGIQINEPHIDNINPLFETLIANNST
jgi:hypothetical protein